MQEADCVLENRGGFFYTSITVLGKNRGMFHMGEMRPGLRGALGGWTKKAAGQRPEDSSAQSQNAKTACRYMHTIQLQVPLAVASTPSACFLLLYPGSNYPALSLKIRQHPYAGSSCNVQKLLVVSKHGSAPEPIPCPLSSSPPPPLLSSLISSPLPNSSCSCIICTSICMASPEQQRGPCICSHSVGGSRCIHLHTACLMQAYEKPLIFIRRKTFVSRLYSRTAVVADRAKVDTLSYSRFKATDVVLKSYCSRIVKVVA